MHPENLAYLPLNLAICFVYWCVSFRILSLQLTPRPTGRYMQYIIAAALAVYNIAVSAFLPAALRPPLNISIIVAIPIALYQGRIWKRLLFGILLLTIYSACELICGALFSLAGIDIANMSGLSLVAFNAACVLMLVFVCMLLRNIPLFRTIEPDRTAILHLLMFLLFIIVIIFCAVCTLYVQAAPEGRDWITRNRAVINIVTIGASLGAFVTYLGMAVRLSESVRLREESRFAEARALAQLEHDRESLARSEEVRRLRHDMKNHLIAIELLGRRGEYDRQAEYLRSLLQSVQETSEPVFTGNALIDLLLEQKQKAAKARDVALQITASPFPADLPLRDIDICTVIGNTLDNAIEAAAESEGRSAKISLRLLPNALLIELRNTCADCAASLARARAKRTSHSKGRGLGLRSVQSTLDRLGGRLILEADPKHAELIADIVLPIQTDT